MYIPNLSRPVQRVQGSRGTDAQGSIREKCLSFYRNWTIQSPILTRISSPTHCSWSKLHLGGRMPAVCISNVRAGHKKHKKLCNSTTNSIRVQRDWFQCLFWSEFRVLHVENTFINHLQPIHARTELQSRTQHHNIQKFQQKKLGRAYMECTRQGWSNLTTEIERKLTQL